jgi:phosphate transport system substrate-binding protein
LILICRHEKIFEGVQMLRKFTQIAVAAGLLAGAVGAAERINGAGASFPAPAYFSWAYSYEKSSGVQINYQSIGSGGGIKQVSARVVEFGASDEPLKKSALEEAKLLQFPSLIGSIVLALNIEGIKDSQLRLKNEVVAEIFLGKITRWSDPRIAADNPALKLPDAPINLIRRSDGSGTTYNFTSFLAGVSKEWRDNFGVGKAVDWASGIAAKGNEGIAAMIAQTPNSIGYLENAYALKNALPRAVLGTVEGKWAEPSNANFKAAAKGAKWSADEHFHQLLVLQPDAYPIVAATFILLPSDDAAKARKITAFFDWAYQNGDEAITKLGYVPLPDEVKEMVRGYWKNIK